MESISDKILIIHKNNQKVVDEIKSSFDIIFEVCFENLSKDLIYLKQKPINRSTVELTQNVWYEKKNSSILANN